MEFAEYINDKKILYDILLQFIEEDNDDDYNYRELFIIIEKQKIQENPEELALFLRLLLQISKNHHRFPNLLKKIEKILQDCFSSIKQTFTNYEIFNIFKSNKLITLFLIKQKVILIDDNIVKEMIKYSQKTFTKYHYFFYPEIKEFLDDENIEEIEKELRDKSINIYTNFMSEREAGENEQYICEMIRNDSINEFIQYTNKKNLSLFSTQIKPTIFETNSFLINKEPSLIEYAAFYGSIQIFQYLKYNLVEMNSSLWFYAIHGHNAEIIHLLEENSVGLPNGKYENCFNESIKCHHNDIADYFKDRYLVSELNSDSYKTIFKCCNYKQIPIELEHNNYAFYYMCSYNYHKLVELFLKPTQENIKNIEIMINEFYYASNQNNTEIIYVLLIKAKITKILELFKGNLNLQEIAIPPTIAEIGEDAFNGCSKLKQISIPSSVNSIGIYAFALCSSLTKILIPSSVTSIGDHAFSECSSLAQISIPSSVTSIGDYAFYGCSSLKQISIPSSVTSIGISTFEKCTSLAQITIPSFVTSIGKSAFDGCSSLEQISIQSSVTSIGDYAFYGCLSLKQIIIPSSLTSIGEYSFSKCSSLTQILIPSSVISIGKSAFERCSSLMNIVIPTSVTSIGIHAFTECVSLKQIAIPSSLTSIENGVFSGCYSLSKVTIPSSVTLIGDSAFSECTSLQQIAIPSSIKKINNFAFAGCSSLEQISISSPLISIEYKAFSRCSSLTQVSISSYVTKIGDYAFEECSLLTRVSIPYIKWCNNHIFDKCYSLNGLRSDVNYDPNPMVSYSYSFLSLLVILAVENLFVVSWAWRIIPWFAHGYKSGKTVYHLLQTFLHSISIIFCLFLLNYIIRFFIYIMSKLMIYQRSIELYIMIRNIIEFLIAAIVFIISLYIIICGIIVSSYALRNHKIEGKPVKCLKYVLDGYQGAKDWSVNQSSQIQNKLKVWHSNMIKKAYGKNGEITNYYCYNVGLPMLILSNVAFVVWFITLCSSLNCEIICYYVFRYCIYSRL